jgi:hypothetical protein
VSEAPGYAFPHAAENESRRLSCSSNVSTRSPSGVSSASK